jgi:thermostable 8-oxoguanine DNA glycosylase
MIDPIHFTNYCLDKAKLEEYILFCIAVYGKNALVTAKNLDKFLKHIGYNDKRSPFEALQKLHLNEIIKLLPHFGIGCYNVKGSGMHYISHANLDLKTCSSDDLRKCPGISFKSACFFILHTRENARVACLDTHILKWLRDQGYKNVPKSSPQTKKIYDKWQDVFLNYADNHNLGYADLDLKLWNEYRSRK